MGISEKAIVAGDDVLKYIPQRKPIVMIDSFYGMDGVDSVHGLSIKEDNVFCEDEYFRECGIIEHIAQSAAFRTGYHYISKGEDVPLGFIGSVSSFKLFNLPKVGDSLITTITVETEVFGITLLKGVVKAGDVPVAECQMKVAISESK